MASTEAALLAAAQQGDRHAFDRLVDGYRRELLGYCYRLLGSLHDAEDALQDALLGAWRGVAGFEGRSSFKSWLYRVATNACRRAASRRQPRSLAYDRTRRFSYVSDLGEIVEGPVWLEPFPDDAIDATQPGPEARFEAREGVELALIHALQRLPVNQRAVLVLRDVLGFSAAEVAGDLEMSVAAVNSALQRARASLAERLPARSQRAELAALGDQRKRQLVTAFVDAWARADVDAMRELFTDDARFSMPPLPAWFDGRDAILRFVAERVSKLEWRLLPMTTNGQLAVAHYQRGPGESILRLGALNVLAVRGDRICEMTGFLEPTLYPAFNLPLEWSDENPPPAR